MTAAPLVFLDASILFSAALGGSTFTSILELAESGAVRLASTRACVAEAVTNLERKRQGSIGALAGVLIDVHLGDPDLTGYLERAETLVGTDDARVLAGALAMQATVLVTGDVKDFGHLMERTDLPLRVRTPRAFFLEHPS